MGVENFKDIVSTEEELRSILGYPSERVARKAIPSLDQHCLDFIAKSPFLLMSTSNDLGQCDVSPRGDAPGFVHFLDENLFIIPERPGNRRIDSMRNILSNPQIGMVFIIPGLEETLRVNGRAYILRDQELLQKMEVKGRVPQLGIGVVVEECFIHCAKAFLRSQLWVKDSWTTRESLPSVAQILADHIKLSDVSAKDISEDLQESYFRRLY
jgi:PPOX class probable FMN-dependent enzyme